MIEAIEHNLRRGVKLLNSISDNQFSDTSVGPYHSSIGGHIRHILDIFDCIFDGLESKEINLAARKRNELAEIKTTVALDYFDRILRNLKGLENANLDQIVEVLIEKESKKSSEHWSGRTEHNSVAVFPKEYYNIGDFVNVKIIDCTSATLIGNAVEYSKNN